MEVALNLFTMKKNTYYFSHDYNAHNDFKILFLRQQLGMEGYGIYWFLIESLANSNGTLPLKIIPALSMQMHTTEAKVEAVIKHFELFEITENDFFSIRLNKNLQKLHDIKEINSIKGQKSAEAKRLKTLDFSTAVEPRLNRGSTKERKGKENKEENTESILNSESVQKEEKKESALKIENSNLFRQPIIPTKNQIWEFFSGAGGTKEMAKSFFEKHEATGWFLNNSPIVKWQALANRFIATWKEREEAQQKKSTPQQVDPTKVKIVLK